MTCVEVKTSAVIVTYEPDLVELRRAMEALSNQVEAFIVVDNGSSQDVGQVVDSFSLPVSFIKNRENRGIACAMNQGALLGLESGATHILFLDQDSFPPENFVKVLSAEFSSLSASFPLAAIGPVIKDIRTSYEYPAVSYSLLRRRSQKVPFGAFVLCDHVISSGMFISLSCYQKVGPFDESLFIDFVDIEWGLRAKKMGYCCAMTSQTCLEHKIGNSVAKFWFGTRRRHSIHSPQRAYYLSRNPWLMLRKSSLPLSYRIQEILRSFPRAVLLTYFSAQRLQSLVYCLKGFLHGILGISPSKQNIASPVD